MPQLFGKSGAGQKQVIVITCPPESRQACCAGFGVGVLVGVALRGAVGVGFGVTYWVSSGIP